MNKLCLSRSAFLTAVGVSVLAGLAALPASAQANPALSGPLRDPVPLRAQDPAPSRFTDGPVETTPTIGPSRQTENLISKVSMLSSEQVRLSQIAAQRTSTAQVRTFARQIQASSQRLEQDIDQLAHAKNVLVPTGKEGNEVARDDPQWEQKGGKEFDGDFVKRIVKANRESIEALENYRQENNADPELTAFADKHLPALRENLRQAEDLKRQME